MHMHLYSCHVPFTHHWVSAFMYWTTISHTCQYNVFFYILYYALQCFLLCTVQEHLLQMRCWSRLPVSLELSWPSLISPSPLSLPTTFLMNWTASTVCTCSASHPLTVCMYVYIVHPKRFKYQIVSSKCILTQCPPTLEMCNAFA